MNLPPKTNTSYSRDENCLFTSSALWKPIKSSLTFEAPFLTSPCLFSVSCDLFCYVMLCWEGGTSPSTAWSQKGNACCYNVQYRCSRPLLQCTILRPLPEISTLSTLSTLLINPNRPIHQQEYPHHNQYISEAILACSTTLIRLLFVTFHCHGGGRAPGNTRISRARSNLAWSSLYLPDTTSHRQASPEHNLK